MDAAARTRRSRRAAYIRWSKEDPVAGTAAAREGFYRKFEREVDPDGVLPPDERARRADRAMKAHMQGIRMKKRKG